RRAVVVGCRVAQPEGDGDAEVVAVVAAVVFVERGIVVAASGLVLLGPGLSREAEREQHGGCDQALANAHCCSPSCLRRSRPAGIDGDASSVDARSMPSAGAWPQPLEGKGFPPSPRGSTGLRARAWRPAHARNGEN